MRAELDAAGTPRALPAGGERSLRTLPRRRRGRIGAFELGVLSLFAALSLWVLALDLFQVVAHGRVWTGTDGFYLVDQMQYLAWIREASHHLLVSNLFVLRGSPADYFQPAVAISGGLSALGLAPWVALLLWKPVAVFAAFYAVNEFVRRSLSGTWPRRAALVLALYFGSFTVIYGSVGVVGDLFPAFLSWGYTFGLLSLAAMVTALMAYDRRRSSGRGGLAWTPALLGAFASSLHPWQGELLILVVVGAELALWRSRTRTLAALVLPAVTVLATALPLVYYLILGRVDESWQLARVASKHAFSIWTIALAIGPLALPAVLAYARRPRSFLGAATRVWPLAALAIFVLSATNLSATPLHAFEGITIPLAVLAVAGLERAGFSRLPRHRLIAGLAVAAVTIPAILYELRSARQVVAPSPGNANFIAHDERHALEYLARDRSSGGVFTRFYLGAVVPAETGRRTFVGDCLWSQPQCSSRAELAELVFDDSLPPEVSRTFVKETGARFVLADCQAAADMDRVLAPLTTEVHRFGCSTIYVLSPPGRPAGPLAESPPDATLRAPGRQQRRVQPS